jgi:hypothetical protein
VWSSWQRWSSALPSTGRSLRSSGWLSTWPLRNGAGITRLLGPTSTGSVFWSECERRARSPHQRVPLRRTQSTRGRSRVCVISTRGHVVNRCHDRSPPWRSIVHRRRRAG